MLAAVLANVHRDPSRRPYTPEEFMPGAEEHRQTPEEQLAIMEALAARTVSAPQEPPSS